MKNRILLDYRKTVAFDPISYYWHLSLIADKNIFFYIDFFLEGLLLMPKLI